MADRVTGAEVKEIFDTDLTAAELAPFITAANLTVTKLVGANTDLSDAQKKEIERWLSAHFAAIRDQIEVSKVVGAAQTKFQGKTEMGLDFTSYGQMVKVLDTSGTFGSADGKKAELKALVP